VPFCSAPGMTTVAVLAHYSASERVQSVATRNPQRRLPSVVLRALQAGWAASELALVATYAPAHAGAPLCVRDRSLGETGSYHFVCRRAAVPDGSLYWQGEGATCAVWVVRGQPMTSATVVSVTLVLVKTALVRLAMAPSLHIDLASGLEYRHHLC
jgi:hypothetical protein